MRHETPNGVTPERRAAPPAGHSSPSPKTARPIDCGHDRSRDGDLEPVDKGARNDDRRSPLGH